MTHAENPLLALFEKAPDVRPWLNVGCLLDVPTGVIYRGKRGNSIVNGGLPKITGVGGRGNMYKSTISHHYSLSALAKYIRSILVAHDTEGSGSPMRYCTLAQGFEEIAGLDLVREGRLSFSDLTVMFGSKWFDQLRALVSMKIKDPKTYIRETPFLDASGKPIMAMLPTIGELDGISQMTIEEVSKLYDKAEVGDSELNAEAMRSSMAKNQMLLQMPYLTGSGGLYMLITAHVGDEIIMDKYAGDKKKLSFMKGNIKFKATPEKFTFLTDVLLYCRSLEILINQTTKAPEFPRDANDNIKGDTDLQAITVQYLRNKQGKTGGTFDIVVSQSEGVKEGLTNLRYLRQNKETSSSPGWGMGGHDKGYYCELYPEVKMQRTTARRLCDNDYKLNRAMEITAEIHQLLHNSHHRLESKYYCTAEELYTQLKAAGYDWDVLLETSKHWCYTEDEDDRRPELSTVDILRMRLPKDDPDYYKPYWMK